MTAPRRAWEMQTGESPKAFEAWVCYRDMSTSQRSYALVGKKLEKSSKLIARWASQYKWQERILAWQSFLDEKAVEGQLKELEKQRKEDRERERTLGLTMISKVAERMNDKKKPLKCPDGQIALWSKTGVELIRVSDGLSLGRMEQDITVEGSPMEVTHTLDDRDRELLKRLYRSGKI